MTNSKKEILYKFQNRSSILVFLTGAIIHIISLDIGREKFIQYLYTPLFDSIFAMPMTFAGIAGIFLGKNMFLDKVWKKIFYWIGVLYLVFSIPFHIQTLITNDTTYIKGFPDYYSYIVIPVMLFFTWFFTRVKFKKTVNTPGLNTQFIN